jgi:hypothetical protein
MTGSAAAQQCENIDTLPAIMRSCDKVDLASILKQAVRIQEKPLNSASFRTAELSGEHRR